jgi:hypothetical protein
LLGARWLVGATGAGGDANAQASTASNTSETATGAGGTGAGGTGAGGTGAGGTGATEDVGANSSASDGGVGGTRETNATGGTLGAAGTGVEPSDPLGAHPFDDSPITRGGTMTFTNVGSEGWWPRRIDREPGDPACDYKDGSDTWGGHCCMTEHETSSTTLAPFDEEMTLILKAIRIKQLAVYQPDGALDASAWSALRPGTAAVDPRTSGSLRRGVAAHSFLET